MLGLVKETVSHGFGYGKGDRDQRMNSYDW